MASYLTWSLLLLAACAQAELLGTATSIEEFPGIVQVEVGVQGLFWTQQCAGSIMTSYHILTLAKCFEGPVEYRRIRAGSDTRGTGGVITYISSANLHPDHEYDSDIAIVFLQNRLELNGVTMQQIPILGEGIELPVGLQVQLAGWGTTVEGGAVSSPNLYTLNLFVTSNEGCLLKYYGEKIITERHVCVGETYLTGRRYDARDLGTPIYYQGTLVGLVSDGKSEDNDYPVVSTFIGAFTSWIIANAI